MLFSETCKRPRWITVSENCIILHVIPKSYLTSQPYLLVDSFHKHEPVFARRFQDINIFFCRYIELYFFAYSSISFVQCLSEIQLFCPRITVDTILLCLTQVWTSKLPAPSKALHNWSNYSLEKRLQVIYHRLDGFLPTFSKIFLVLKNSNFYLLSYLNNAENL